MSQNVSLRQWTESDVDSLTKYANNKKIFDNMRDMFPYPYTLTDAENFIKRVSGDNPTKVFAIDVDGEAIGSVGVFPKEDISRISAEVGYWVGEPFWGRGYATIALKSIIDYGFKNFDINRIYAIPFPSNSASQKVIQKSGLKLEAILKQSMIKNGIIIDEYIYAILREDWNAMQ